MQSVMDILYHHAKFGGDWWTHSKKRRKAMVFFACVGMARIRGGNAVKQCIA